MVMASIDVKIRHVFGDTPITEASIGAAPPENSIAQWKKNRNGANLKHRHTLRAGGVINLFYFNLFYYLSPDL